MKKESEAAIQQRIVVYFRNTYCLKHHNPRFLIFSVPNERKSFMEMKMLLLTGLFSGVSDLIVVRQGKVDFVEVKTPTGVQSDNQKAFQRIVESLGFQYYIVRSLEDFKTAIQ